MKCDFNKLHRYFIQITLHNRCCPVNLLRIFRTLFHRNTSGELLLQHLFLRNIAVLEPQKPSKEMKKRTHELYVYITEEVRCI